MSGNSHSYKKNNSLSSESESPSRSTSESTRSIVAEERKLFDTRMEVVRGQIERMTPKRLLRGYKPSVFEQVRWDNIMEQCNKTTATTP